jgi:hypothetical protein
MPESFSLEKYCPTPGNQGNYGTCVAFANGYGVATILYAQTHGLENKSLIDKYAFSSSFLYEKIKNPSDLDCQNGSDPITALFTMTKDGDALNSTVPYSCGSSIADQANEEAKSYRILDYSILFAQSGMLTVDDYVLTPESAIQSTKKALLEGSPVSCAFFLPETFFRITSDVWYTNPAIDTPSDWKHSGHAMVVVGYDDYKEGGAFRVLNSWGTDWADGGYVWMRYNDFIQWCAVALQPFANPFTKEPEEKKVIEPDPIPTPDVDPSPSNTFSLSGNLECKLNNGIDMPVSKVTTRNLVIADDEDEEKAVEDMVAYTMQNTYSSGTKFRLYISTNDDCYIYAFSTDLTGKVNLLLPYDELTSTHIGSNSVVAFPSDTKVIKLDEEKGTDYLLVLYSKYSLNAKDIKDAMNNMKGSLSKKIRSALGSKLIDETALIYDTERVGFSVDWSNTSRQAGGDNQGVVDDEAGAATVVPLMVEISHQ